MRGHFEKPGARNSQFFIFPANLVKAWLLQYVPKAFALLLMGALTVEQTEKQKLSDIDLPIHVLFLLLFTPAGTHIFRLEDFAGDDFRNVGIGIDQVDEVFIVASQHILQLPNAYCIALVD